MIAFAVHHEGIPADADGNPGGRWVLAIAGNRLLLADNDGKFYWQNMDTCRLFRAHTPDAATLIAPHPLAAGPQGPGLVLPPNGMQHRMN